MRRVWASILLGGALVVGAACESAEQRGPQEAIESPSDSYTPPPPATMSPTISRQPEPKPSMKPPAPPPPRCHSSYSGACLRADASDYDCAGGSGNGPYYAQGPFTVVGPDQYDLDRDGDGTACE